jgi:hypothetical protein
MTDNAGIGQSRAEPRVPDGAVRALERLVGTWRISGDANGAVTYRWLEGGFFLVQEGELELFGHRNRFTEIIGRERPFEGEPSADIKSRVYTAEGDTLDYVYELDDDKLTIWGGERGSPASYTATFSDDGNTLSGEWSWPGGGYKTVNTRQPDATTSSEA